MLEFRPDWLAKRALTAVLILLHGIAAAAAQTPASKVKCADDPPPRARARAINGTPATSSSWPWFAALEVRDEVKNVALAFCGGAIIAPNWVLTAGHCLHFIDKSTLRTSYYGETDPTILPTDALLEVIAGVDDLRKAKPENVYPVAEIFMNDDYAPAYEKWARALEAAKRGQGSWPIDPNELVGHDLALVKLARPWSGALAPAAVGSDADDVPKDGHASVAGFGSVEVVKDTDGSYIALTRKYDLPGQRTLYAGCAHLMQVTMPIVATQQCAERFRDGDFQPVIGEQQICAGFDLPNQDSCNGDSGGPLMITSSDGKQRYAGIVSWGPRDCAGAAKSYGVYTRVAKFTDWIERTGNLALARGGEPSPVNRSVFVRFALDDLNIDLGDVKDKVRLEIENGPAVKLGQTYRLAVTSDVSGRLIIIDVDAANTVTQIFPNKFMTSEGSTNIQAGTRTTIPMPGWGFDAFQAQEPLGGGVLVAVVVPDDFPKLTYGKEMEEQVANGFEPVRNPTSYVMNLIQQIGQRVAEARAKGDQIEKAWAYVSVDYQIVP